VFDKEAKDWTEITGAKEVIRIDAMDKTFIALVTRDGKVLTNYAVSNVKMVADPEGANDEI